MKCYQFCPVLELAHEDRQMMIFPICSLFIYIVQRTQSNQWTWVLAGGVNPGNPPPQEFWKISELKKEETTSKPNINTRNYNSFNAFFCPESSRSVIKISVTQLKHKFFWLFPFWWCSLGYSRSHICLCGTLSDINRLQSCRTSLETCLQELMPSLMFHSFFGAA
jgi:hypothetical protein